MSQADIIRKFVDEKRVQSARQRGDDFVEISVDDVQTEMEQAGLLPSTSTEPSNHRRPNICNALQSPKFENSFQVRLCGSRQPPSTGVVLKFRIESG